MRGIITLLVCLAPICGLAADVPSGTWRVEQIALELYPCDQAACGKIVWVQNPAKRHLCGRVIIWGLTSDGSPQWSGGQFYDPENDKTYDLNARVESHDLIAARIYKGVPLIGRTEILTRIPSHSLAGWCA